MNIQLKNSKYHYGAIARILHWSSVMMLVALIYLSGQFENLDQGGERSDLVNLHTSLGVLFLLLMVLRLIWRGVNLNPLHSYNLHSWQKKLAFIIHRLIYFVLIFECLIGLFILFAVGGVIIYFNFEIGGSFTKNVFLSQVAIDLHRWVSFLIYPLLALHISAAIYHQIFGVVDD